MNATLTLPTATPRVSMSALSLPSLVGFSFAARETYTYLFFTSSPDLGAQVTFAISIALLLIAAFASYGSSVDVSFTRSKPLRWVFAFFAVSLSSLAWGETVSLPIALAYWIGLAADTATILLIARTEHLRALATRVLGGYICGVLLIACVMWCAPTMQDLRPGDDEFFSPNAIACTLGIGCFLAQYLMRSNRIWKWAAIFLAISVLRSLSKTTLIAFTIGQLIFLLGDRSLTRAAKRNILLAAATILAAFSPLIARYSNVYLNAGNSAVTLTGRIGIWSFVLLRGFERPWFGHGFHSFRHVIPAFGTFETWHAHNELIQQFYLYGAVGIVLMLGIYTSFYLLARRQQDPRHRALFTGLIVYILVRGLADSERFDLSFPLWSIVLLSLLLTEPFRPTEANPS